MLLFVGEREIGNERIEGRVGELESLEWESWRVRELESAGRAGRVER